MSLPTQNDLRNTHVSCTPQINQEYSLQASAPNDSANGVVALEACGVSLSWAHNNSALVVKDCNISVRSGEIVCLVGRSGTGKTTLLHALAGLLLPQTGEVYSFGTRITGEAGHVSYMFQNDLLLSHKRVIDNVALPLVLKGTPVREARAQVAPLFETCGLSGYEMRWPSELSGGMRQRVAFMRTYTMGNTCVLLDEPFSALDAMTRVEMRQWYTEMAHQFNLATLAITHDVDEALMMATRVYVLGHSYVQTWRDRSLDNESDEHSSISATIVGEISVSHPDNMTAAEFSLTEDFLTAKRQILALL